MTDEWDDALALDRTDVSGLVRDLCHALDLDPSGVRRLTVDRQTGELTVLAYLGVDGVGRGTPIKRESLAPVVELAYRVYT